MWNYTVDTKRYIPMPYPRERWIDRWSVYTFRAVLVGVPTTRWWFTTRRILSSKNTRSLLRYRYTTLVSLSVIDGTLCIRLLQSFIFELYPTLHPPPLHTHTPCNDHFLSLYELQTLEERIRFLQKFLNEQHHTYPARRSPHRSRWLVCEFILNECYSTLATKCGLEWML